jgi:hypothetical protein
MLDNLIFEFTIIENELNTLTLKYRDKILASECGKSIYKQIELLEEFRAEKIKRLFNKNIVDELHDHVHDSILSKGEDIPNGYSVVIVTSYYSSIMRHFKTIGYVTTPNNTNYFIEVLTFSYIKPGTKYVRN